MAERVERQSRVEALAAEGDPMETFPIERDATYPIAFEIEHIYVSRRTIAGLLGQVEGVRDVRLGRSFASTDDIRIEFKYLNQDYIVWEPYGDNSRYWIGPKDTKKNSGDIHNVEKVFKHYRPPLYREILGDLVSFRLFKRLGGRR